MNIATPLDALPDSVDINNVEVRTLTGAETIAYGPHEAAAIYILHSGSAALECDDGARREFAPGEIAVITRPLRHRIIGRRLSEEDGRRHADIRSEFEAPVQLTAVNFHDAGPSPSVLETLPPLLSARLTELPGGLPYEHLVQLLVARPDPLIAGADYALTRLTRLLLCLVLRTHWERSGGEAWSAAFEPDISRAMRMMEHRPAEEWTLARLAGEVSLSRSAFAQKFKEQVGRPPMQFLLDTRMKAALPLLKNRRRPLKEVARLVGYRSASAFSTAFKRWSGTSPGAYSE